MSFLEASKLSKTSEGLVEMDIGINSSVSLHQLHLYIQAFGVNIGRKLCIKSIDFGTLKQSLYQDSIEGKDIFILFPWDFFGSLDWRTGVVSTSESVSSALTEVDDFFELISTKENGYFFYLDADFPPVMGLKNDMCLLKEYISFSARKLNCTMVDPNFFCLKTYLANGCPFSSISLSLMGKSIVEKISGMAINSKKVIVTDLDFTFWHGVLGEIGPSGIQYSPSGKGYIHFIYQTFLKKLKDAGVLICICSKNDLDLVELAFKENQFTLDYEEFVSIQASYNSKSSQIKSLSCSLNIGLHDFVFVDDNALEIEEVKIALPEINCIQFPEEVVSFSNMLEKLHELFQISNITKEDADRTELYKRMNISKIDSSDVDTNIDEFLKALKMQVNLTFRTVVNNERALQLINKTNQFNSNGVRFSKDECDQLLSDGARLITAHLKDKNGDHGEVLVILVDSNNLVLSFVMSCRVFQRQAEIMFLSILFETGIGHLVINYKETNRNEPFKLFLSKFFSKVSSGTYTITPKLISDNYPNVKKLYEVNI